VVDGVVGDWLCARYGLLAATPLTIEIAGNRIVSCASVNKQLEADFWAYTHTTRTPTRGEFAIAPIWRGARDRQHPAGREVSGDSHCVRNPYGEHTGAPWRSGTHIDVVGWVQHLAGNDAGGTDMRDGLF